MPCAAPMSINWKRKPIFCLLPHAVDKSFPYKAVEFCPSPPILFDRFSCITSPSRIFYLLHAAFQPWVDFMMNLHSFTWPHLVSPPLICAYVIGLLPCLFFPLSMALTKTHFLRRNGFPSFTILLPIIQVELPSSVMGLKVLMVAVVLSGVVHLRSSLTSLHPLLFSLLNYLLSHPILPLPNF